MTIHRRFPWTLIALTIAAMVLAKCHEPNYHGAGDGVGFTQAR